MKLKITKTALISIPAPKSGRLIVHDTMTPGLAVMITSGDARTFYVVKWQAGKMKWVRLGPVSRDALDGGLTIEKARSMVRDVNARLAAGEDPNAEKRAAREGATLGDLWRAYEQTHAIPHKKPASVEQDRLNYQNHLKVWASKRLTEITQAHVKTLHVRLGQKSGPYAANRVLALLSTMFNKCSGDLGFDPRDNPARGVKRFAEKQRDRVLRADELQRLLQAVADDPDADARDYITLALFTGARRANVLGMRWQDISVQRAMWKVPGEVTKNGDPLVISLAPQAIEILNRRPDHSPYVFPAKMVTQEQVEQARRLRQNGVSTRRIAMRLGLSQTAVVRMLKPDFVAGEPRSMEGPRQAWDRILKAAGIEERTTLHDLRRTFASWMVKSGASLSVVAAAMGHRSLATTQRHYAHADADTVRAATFASVNAIAQAAQAKPDAKAAS